ncbi:MAG: phosphoglycerate kinase [Candidatus Sulfobium sp.]
MSKIDPRLSLVQNAPIEGKVVLVRFDHNVVKNGQIRDPYRIDRTLGTLYNIVERGGRPILMTHIGRPRDKKSGEIHCREEESVKPIVEYLERKLHIRFHIPEFPVSPGAGITGIDTSINHAIRALRERRIGGIYLPNTRWFQAEEVEGEMRDKFAHQLAGLADIFVNDAFGSWQPHVSTYDITKYLPSYAGFLMQEEILNLDYVLSPARPFTAVVAGAKYDTKIGPLYAIYRKADRLILGGVIYNTFLCAKYGVRIAGVSEKDIEAAKELVDMDKSAGKIVSSTIFVNAVMGLTPHFYAGSQALDETIDGNSHAKKLYGGGDTLQEFKDLCPGLYLSVLDNAQYYFFTGGGTVLTAIEQGTPYGLKPVQALMENGGATGHL